MTSLNKKYKKVDFSKTTITELMIPSYANFSGKIHGGILLSLMDKLHLHALQSIVEVLRYCFC